MKKFLYKMVRFDLSEVDKSLDRTFSSDRQESIFNKLLNDDWEPVSIDSVKKDNTLIILFKKNDDIITAKKPRPGNKRKV